MADANRSGRDDRAEDEDPERTQRLPATEGAVNRWFSGQSDTPVSTPPKRPKRGRDVR